MTVLFAVSVLAEEVGPTLINSPMLTLVLRLAGDTVPNIRFNVAKTLKSLIKFVDQTTIQTKIKPCLLKLLDDPDKDVKFFAHQALSNCPP